MTRKKYFFPVILTGLFILFILAVIPKGAFYGSYTDWLSQHVRLAETIRDTCVRQKTLVPAFLPLGSGSNGYQFSYYGYLRPDIVIGCLLPSVPMVWLLTGYMLAGYLCSVLLCYYFLKSEDGIGSLSAFAGSVLFMTAACFFHTHRQVMFVNYMPFLIMALIAVQKKRFRFLPLILFFIYVNSFYYSIACLAAIGWYWLRQEGRGFWKNGFPCFLKSAFLSVGMAALLLIPTGLVILEHRRSSASLSLPEIFGVSLNLQSVLYSPYGMGLTAVCLYALILGVTSRKYRIDSIFLLIISTWFFASWILNGTLYARAKILIPFVPLVILQCTRILSLLRQEGFSPEGSGEHTEPKPEHRKVSNETSFVPADTAQEPLRWKLWPCFIVAAFLPAWIYWENFVWIAADIGLLLLAALWQKIHCYRKGDQIRFFVSHILLCIMPCLLFLQTMQKEDFVDAKDVFKQDISSPDLPGMDPLYRYDSLADVLATCNVLSDTGVQKSGMYSSITNKEYSNLYYDTFHSAVQINNRLAVLPSANPFLLNFFGVRYLQTTKDNLPCGYSIVSEETGSGEKQTGPSDGTRAVLAENGNVLPIAYFTNSCITDSQFLKLKNYDRLDAITRYTVVPDGENAVISDYTKGMKEYAPAFKDLVLPDTIHVTRTNGGYMLDVKAGTTVTLNLEQALKNKILLLDFDVINQGKSAVVIDINSMRNKLSGASAPYPNENDTFHYQLSDASGKGLDSLKLKFSKGKYFIKNITWHLYDEDLLSEKPYTPVVSHETKDSEILSCTADAPEDGYFVTSIPLQKGMEITVDGENVPILKINRAFAGVKLEKGKHDIRVIFRAPGQKAGYAVSISCFLIYLISTVFSRRKNDPSDIFQRRN